MFVYLAPILEDFLEFDFPSLQKSEQACLAISERRSMIVMHCDDEITEGLAYCLRLRNNSRLLPQVGFEPPHHQREKLLADVTPRNGLINHSPVFKLDWQLERISTEYLLGEDQQTIEKRPLCFYLDLEFVRVVFEFRHFQDHILI